MFVNFFDIGYQLVLTVLLFSVAIPWIAMIHAPARLPLQIAAWATLTRAAWGFLGPYFMYRLMGVSSIVTLFTVVGMWGGIAVAVGMIVLKVKDEAAARESQ